MLAVGTIRNFARGVHRRLTRSGIILLYHRVADLPSDAWSLAVTPAHFAEHLVVLRRYGNPLRLDHYVRARDSRTLPRRPIVLTFDDGYADNLHEAKPLLQRAEVPATVFVSTEYLGQIQEVWWDELDRLLLQPGHVPPTLGLTIEGTTHSWDLGRDATYSESAQRQYRAWRFWHERAPTVRHQVYRQIWHLLQPLSHLSRQKTLMELRQWSKATPQGRTTHRMMTPEEVRTLGAKGLVEIGSHTVTHPKLSAISAGMQRQELQQSKRRLEEILEHPVTSFAYPYGSRAMYTAETVSLVREVGYTCACANYPGLVESHHSVFELPRIRVHDWSGDEFERRLRHAFKETWT
jgi:peptidoglycan/xylan/chitin deacetylase (PgdA/CDA1 family)